ITLTNEMLESAKEKGFSSFSRILLVGGSTRMPQVRKRLETEFPGIPIEFNDPDEAVAKGAALFAQKLMIDGKIKEELFKLMGDDAKGKTIEEVERENPEAFKQANETTSIDFGLPPSVVEKLAKITVKNCTSKSFGVIVLDRTTNKEIIANLILKNKSLPATVSQKFGTIENNQPSVQLQIVESLITDKEISDLSLATKIGDSTLPLPPGLPENSPIEITFSFDDAGLLQYSGRDLSSDNHIEGEIKTDAVMSEEDVAQAIERMKKITVI
ncbi:MAG TPA: Hsp70 family protein, partial [bacterium]|nr:Hsp70 family protein [bacterium]